MDGRPPPSLTPPPPHTHTPARQTYETKPFPNNVAVSAAHWPKSDLSGKRTNARVQTMSTWPKPDVLCQWCEHWHHRADRRARRGERTSSFAGSCCSICSTKLNRRLSGVGGKAKSHWVASHVRSRALRACPTSLCAAQHCVRVRALRRRRQQQQQLARDVLNPSTSGCKGARRGAQPGRSLQCVCCVGCCLPARWNGERRRHIRRNKERWEGWGARQGGWRGL